MKLEKITTVFSLGILFGYTVAAQTPGTLDLTFGKDGYKILDVLSKDQVGAAIALQPDGKIVAGGMHVHGPDTYDWLIYRLNTDGNLDQTFDSDGSYLTSFGSANTLNDLAIQQDGKILVCGFSDFGGTHSDLVVQRLNSWGSVDNGFGQGGTIRLDPSVGANDYAIRISEGPNQKIYLASQMDILGDVYFSVHRFLPDGSPDSTFGFDGNTFMDMNGPGALTDMTIAADGSVFLGGYVQVNNSLKMAVVKITNTGNLDFNFGNNGAQIFTAGVNKPAGLFGLTLTEQNKILAVGIRIDNQNNSLLVQLKANGQLDSTFHQVGYVEYDLGLGNNDALTKIAPLANGKFLAMGFVRDNNTDKGLLLQLDSLGNIDVNNFGNGSGIMVTQLSNDDDLIRDFACNNGSTYAIGDFNNPGQSDIFIAKSFLDNPLSVTNNTLKSSEMKIFPNPARITESVELHLNEKITGLVKIEVNNSSGQIIYSEEFFKISPNYFHTIKLNNPARGLYTIIVNHNGKAGYQKLILN